MESTNDANFKADVLDSDVPVVLDLWATWCQPCIALAPLLESAVDDLGGKIKGIKLDIQSNPQTPAKYGVTSIPTLLVIKNGEVVDRMVGNPGTKSRIKSFLEKNL